MINIDYITLNAFYKENKDFLENARIQKIQQTSRRDLILTLRNHSFTKKLYINVNPKYYHIAFLSNESFKTRNLKIPDKPPMFCMLLRKYIDNAKITEVSIPPYERIFELHLETMNELNEMIPMCLAVELMGKHSNIILYEETTELIIGSAHNVGPEKSAYREIRGGVPYCYPQKAEGKQDILRYFGEIDYKNLSNDFLGISKSFSELCAKNNSDLEKIKDYVEGVNKITPAIDFENEIYSIYSELLENPVLQQSVSDMLDNYYSEIQNKEYLSDLKRKIENNLSKKIKKLENTVQKIKTELNKENHCDSYKHYGDLILQNIYQKKDYEKYFVVFDYERNRELKIELDTNKTLKENALNFYEKYKRSKNAREKLKEIYENNKKEKLYYEEMLYGLKHTYETEFVEELYDKLFLGNENKTKTEKTDIKAEEVNINGFKVYIGHNNHQNNFILSKLAKDEDIWFHIKDYPGAHILLKVPDSIIPSKEVIFKCCELAKANSVKKDAGKVGIIYTQKKYLKRPPKTELAYVTYKNETEVLI